MREPLIGVLMSAPWECERCGRIFNDLSHITIYGTCRPCYDTELAAEQEQAHQKATRDLQERQVALLEALTGGRSGEMTKAEPKTSGFDVAPFNMLNVENNASVQLGGWSIDVGGSVPSPRNSPATDSPEVATAGPSEGEDTRAAAIVLQWVRVLEDRIDPEDKIAELALCEAALEALEEHGVEIGRLADLADKRACNKLLRRARKTIKDASEDAIQALEEFKESYAQYKQSLEAGVERFHPAPPPSPPPSEEAPQWIPTDSPPWVERPAPAWVPGVEPQPSLMQPPSRPVEVSPPGTIPPLPDIPSTKTAQDIDYWPKTYVAASATVEWLVETFRYEPSYAEAVIASDGEAHRGLEAEGKWVRLNPDNGWPITVDNVPSEEGTSRRFPRGGSLWRGLFGEPKEWQTCRGYERALREWAAHVKAYDAYCLAIPEWEAASQAVAKENERIMAGEYPKQLRQFREGESQRELEWKAACEAHALKEQTRRREWEEACARHREDEHRRKAAWEVALEAHAERERQREQAWQEASAQHRDSEERRLKSWIECWESFADELNESGRKIRSFLEEHPDACIIWSPVRTEEELDRLWSCASPPDAMQPSERGGSDEKQPRRRRGGSSKPESRGTPVRKAEAEGNKGKPKRRRRPSN